MSLFKGSGVALITPFKYDLYNNIVIDYDTLETLIDFHLNNNTDSIIICGTTGEAATMSENEHIECIKRCVEYVDGKIPVIAGTGSNNTITAIHLSQEAEKVGADGLLCVTPYYNKTNQEGLKLYYKRISDNVGIPIIMYNVPSRTGLNIEPITAKEIYDINKNIVGIKEASGNIEQIKYLNKISDIDIYSGNDDQIYDILECGGIGVISVLANILPNETHNIVFNYLNDNKFKSYMEQEKVLRLCKDLFIDVNPIPVKKACEYLNMSKGIVREPLVELNDFKTKKLVKTIDNYFDKNIKNGK